MSAGYRVGFTGTRKGMDNKQKEAFLRVITKLKIDRFNHGDCKGADEEAHEIITKNQKVLVIIHPPINNKFRAYCSGHKYRDTKEYLERNKTIVDESNLLIAVPSGLNEVRRSGTWSTIRYARRKNKSIIIIYPHGKVSVEDWKLPLIRDGNL